jgi:anaerobic ribonucleoside-triphosphate reductase activating protein
MLLYHLLPQNKIRLKLQISTETSLCPMEYPTLLPQNTLNLATWVSCTSSEGPGLRFALWVQGCTIRCPSCCNPDMFSAKPKRLVPVQEVYEWVRQARQKHSIEGITFLGGEPFEQAQALVALASLAQLDGLSVMVFSGYTLEFIQNSTQSSWHSLLDSLDILVDGPYLHEQRTRQRRWIGSENQRIHFLSKRYGPQDPCWKAPNSMEFFFDGQELQISGFPEDTWVHEIQKIKKSLQFLPSKKGERES